MTGTEESADLKIKDGKGAGNIKNKTCPEGGDWATKHFRGSTTAEIKNGSLKHFFYIDMWFTKAPMTLKITNLKMQGGQKFKDECRAAYSTIF